MAEQGAELVRISIALETRVTASKAVLTGLFTRLGRGERVWNLILLASRRAAAEHETAAEWYRHAQPPSLFPPDIQEMVVEGLRQSTAFYDNSLEYVNLTVRSLEARRNGQQGVSVEKLDAAAQVSFQRACEADEQRGPLLHQALTFPFQPPRPFPDRPPRPVPEAS